MTRHCLTFASWRWQSLSPDSKPCCLDPLFACPVLAAAKEECDHLGANPDSVAQALVHGTVSTDLAVAMRSKSSNIEIELNFARASAARSATHGKGCNISSMISKHITSEVKLARKRCLSRSEEAPLQPPRAFDVGKANVFSSKREEVT